MTATHKYKVLMVDDEPHILDSLQRVLRKENYDLLAANSAEQALSLLFNQPIDLVLSDQRMPGMGGSELLAKVRERYPDTVRVIITGYQDISAAVKAINEGGAHQFLQKPWDDEHLKLSLRKALEQYEMRREIEVLRTYVEQQNKELKELNLNLEKKAEEEAKLAQRKASEATNLYSSLKDNFASLIDVMSSMLSLRDSQAEQHHKKVKEVSEYLCDRLQISGADRVWISTASLLHDIGKVALPEAVLQKPKQDLTPAELKLYRHHPVHGQELVERVNQLRPLGMIIRSHHERWDGKGFPDQLQKDSIPIGSQIIAAASDFQHLRDQMEVAKLRDYFERNSGVAYAPKIAKLMQEYIDHHERELPQFEIAMIKPHQLKAGMVLAEDLRTSAGILMIAKEGELTFDKIQQIQNHHATTPFPNPIAIYAKK